MANTYLSKTIVPNNFTSWNTFTASVWFKIANGGSDYPVLGFNGSNDYFQIRVFQNEGIDIIGYVGGVNVRKRSTAKLRDSSGWYNIVVSGNSTHPTGSERLKVYLNGVLVTDWSTSQDPALNYDFITNNMVNLEVGSGLDQNGGRGYFSGSMSHFHFIDGTAYDASAFGETDATTGEWVAKTSPSVTYGNGGFFILKDGNGITDQSGEGNDFTLGGGTLTDLKDNPDNTFATWNSLFRRGTSTPAFSNGNLTSTFDDGGANEFALTTLGASSGKYYAEIKWTSATGTGATSTGILDMGYSGTADPNNAVTNTFTYFGNGNKNVSGSASSYGSSYTSGDIIGIAMDLDNNKLYFSKNGTWQNSGVPTSGSTGTGAIPTIAGVTYGFMTSDYNNKVCQLNTGNGYFGTTAVTTNSGNGYSGAEGASKFNYTVPTGYSALSTKGLNL